MKCISLWQPWASLIAVGAKRIETRSWTTSYRGPLAIHAAKRFPREAMEFMYQSLASRRALPEYCRGVPKMGVFVPPLGAFVALAELYDVVPTFNLVSSLSDEEREFGDYRAGRYGWMLRNIQPLKERIPAKGMQGLWSIMPTLADQILAGVKDDSVANPTT